MSTMLESPNRVDINLIFDLIPKGSSVLDLGCGEGDLLRKLIDEKQITGRGIEISFDDIAKCIVKGLDVCQINLDEGLMAFADNSFDYVILNQTLQVVRKPDLVIEEMLRIGKRGIIGFPNFGNWKVRTQLLFNGITPKTKTLPYEWYNTPNIRILTLKDFKNFCKDSKIKILEEINLVSTNNNLGRKCFFMPNLLSEISVFVLEK